VTVGLALAGGALLVAILLLFIRISTLEHRLGERVDATGVRVVRRINGRISDLDLSPLETKPVTPIVTPISSRVPVRARRA
jgi:hypothetical protein